MEYINRTISEAIMDACKYYQVITITGPRQVGKTTLCRHLFPDYKYVNLEDIASREIIESDYKRFIEENKSGVIIDEAQNLPDLFSYIMVTVDADSSSRFVITGSCNFSLMSNISQSLAGRTAVFTLLPLSLPELSEHIKGSKTDSLIYNGFYPALFSKKTPVQMHYKNYYNTYIERDIHQLMNIKNSSEFSKFIKLCAGRVGSVFNQLSLASEVGVSAPTIAQWISILERSYIIFKLPPYYKNIGKRLVKSPKIYFYDTGLLCYLLGITDEKQLEVYPLKGAIFENMVVAECFKQINNCGMEPDLYFYRDSHNKEVDLFQMSAGKIKMYEIKSSQTFNQSFLSNLSYCQNLLGEDITSSAVIYDGTDEKHAPSMGVYNYRNVRF